MLFDDSLDDAWIRNFNDAWVSGRDFIYRRAKSALGAAALGLCQAARWGNFQKNWAVSWRCISAHQEASKVLNFLARGLMTCGVSLSEEISICNAPSYAFLLAALR